MLPPAPREHGRWNGSDNGGDGEPEDADSDNRNGGCARNGGLTAGIGKNLTARLGHAGNVRAPTKGARDKRLVASELTEALTCGHISWDGSDHAHDIDVVHTNSLKADIIGGMAGRLAGCFVVWHVRDRIDADYLPPMVARIFRFLAGHVPTYVIANSRATLATLNLSSPRKDFIYSGLDHVVHDGIRISLDGAS